jgi:hypothetical protein
MTEIGFDVGTALPDASVSPLAFPAVYLGEIAVHAYEKDIQTAEEPGQGFAPGLELDHMLDDEIVSCLGKRRQAG